MGIQRAAVLYPVNTTTVDTGSGIDIRLLDSAEAAANDDTQTVVAVNTNDGQSRVFDPATAGNTTNRSVFTLQAEGWGLRLAEDMTPADDTNCNAYLPAQTATITINVTIVVTGTTFLAGTYAPVWGAALWKYNLTSNTATGIGVGGSVGSPSWNLAVIGGDLGTFKVATIPIDCLATEFAADEILLLEVGVALGTIPNPTLGTSTFTYTLRVDNTDTKITWATNKNLVQVCTLSGTTQGRGSASRVVAPAFSRSTIGKGTPTESRDVSASKSFTLDGRGTVLHTKSVTMDLSADGRGVPTESRAVVAAKAFGLTGTGVASRNVAVGIARDTDGVGTPDYVKAIIAAKQFVIDGRGQATESRSVQAQREFDLVGKGIVTRVISVAEAFDLTGVGTVDSQKAVAAAKEFTLDGRGTVTRDGLILAMLERGAVGVGVVTETHPVQAFREFSLTGKGIVTGTITIPIDEVPEGGGGTTFIYPINLSDD